MLRIDPDLHATLRGAAAAMGISLNEYCARKLASPVGDLAMWTPGSNGVRRASSLLGDTLVGVVIFGSWVRDEMHDESDVDLLIVVEDEVELRRELYHRWDEAPIRWRSHRVEPHFVHPPAAGRRAIGLWAEVAVEGLVLYSKDLRLPGALIRLRQDIASGRVQRRTMHGEPYWVEFA